MAEASEDAVKAVEDIGVLKPEVAVTEVSEGGLDLVFRVHYHLKQRAPTAWAARLSSFDVVLLFCHHLFLRVVRQRFRSRWSESIVERASC